MTLLCWCRNVHSQQQAEAGFGDITQQAAESFCAMRCESSVSPGFGEEGPEEGPVTIQRKDAVQLQKTSKWTGGDFPWGGCKLEVWQTPAELAGD